MSSLDPETKKLMESLLLRGERMLGDTCPVCGTPLFLIKSLGLKFCPKCKKYVIKSEEEYKRAKSLGISPGDMIIVGFRPKDLRLPEPPHPSIERPPEPKPERKEVHRHGIHPAVEDLLREVIRLVRDGKYEEAREVAEIILTICTAIGCKE